MKLIDARKDHYRKLANVEGYRSRSSYKLKELHKSYRIIGVGHYVLDLGCAPGGWTQVAVQLAGNKGKVMGVDTSFVEEIPGAYMLKSDICDDSVTKEILSFFGKKVNVVICDLRRSFHPNLVKLCRCKNYGSSSKKKWKCTFQSF